MSIYLIIVLIIIAAYAGLLALKEHRCGQELRRNKKRREENDYNQWLFHTGLHETAYYFNTSGIRIFGGKRMF